jgi:hypothetical protein
VTEAELQVVLNILAEHDFQESFKKMAEALWQWISVEGDYFEGEGG